jgi:hypothetical protein
MRQGEERNIEAKKKRGILSGMKISYILGKHQAPSTKGLQTCERIIFSFIFSSCTIHIRHHENDKFASRRLKHAAPVSSPVSCSKTFHWSSDIHSLTAIPLNPFAAFGGQYLHKRSTGQ